MTFIVSAFPSFLNFSVFPGSSFLIRVLSPVSLGSPFPQFLNLSVVRFLSFYVSRVSTFLVFCVFVFSKILCFSDVLPFSCVSVPQCLSRRSFRRFAVSPFLVFCVYLFSAFSSFLGFRFFPTVSFSHVRHFFPFVSFPQCLLRRSVRRFSISPFLVFSFSRFSWCLTFLSCVCSPFLLLAFYWCLRFVSSLRRRFSVYQFSYFPFFNCSSFHMFFFHAVLRFSFSFPHVLLFSCFLFVLASLLRVSCIPFSFVASFFSSRFLCSVFLFF